MGLFGPKKPTVKTYQDFEIDLYVALEILKRWLSETEVIDEKYYCVNSMDKVYKKPFNLCYGLVGFYTKYTEGNKSFQFKKNFLLSKTRGLFSGQKKGPNSPLSELYYIPVATVNSLPDEYFTMFHLNKKYTKEELMQKNEEE